MAERLIFKCGKCAFTVEAWSDGNPYILMPDGSREHFYHPGEPAMIEEICGRILGHTPTWQEREAILQERAGNESDHLCLGCGTIAMYNPERDELKCSECGGDLLADTFKLEGRRCPRCGGTFGTGEHGGIS